MPGLASLQMGAVNTMSQRIRSGNVVLDMAVAGLLSAAIASAIAFFDKWLRPRAVELWQHLLAYFGDAELGFERTIVYTTSKTANAWGVSFQEEQRAHILQKAIAMYLSSMQLTLRAGSYKLLNPNDEVGRPPGRGSAGLYERRLFIYGEEWTLQTKTGGL